MLRDLLLRRISGFCQLSSDQLDKLELHYDLMVRWNKVLNLTRIVRVEEAVDLHHAESLFLASQLPAGLLEDCGSRLGRWFSWISTGCLAARVLRVADRIPSAQGCVFEGGEPDVGERIRVAARAEQVNDRFDWVVSRAVSSLIEAVAFELSGNVALLGGRVPGGASKTVDIPWAENRRVAIVSRETKS